AASRLGRLRLAPPNLRLYRFWRQAIDAQSLVGVDETHESLEAFVLFQSRVRAPRERLHFRQAATAAVGERGILEDFAGLGRDGRRLQRQRRLQGGRGELKPADALCPALDIPGRRIAPLEDGGS